MKSKEYITEIQELHKEADECLRQMSLINETAQEITREEILGTLDDAVDELYEQYSAIITRVNNSVINLTQLDDPFEAMVLIFLYHRSYTFEEIAHRLHMPVGQVKRIHGNAMQSLEALIEEFEEDAEEE